MSEEEDKPVQAINRVEVDPSETVDSGVELPVSKEGESWRNKVNDAVNPEPPAATEPVADVKPDKKAPSTATYIRGFVELLSKQNDSYRFGSGDRSDITKTERILEKYLKDNDLEPVDKNWIKLTDSEYRESWRNN